MNKKNITVLFGGQSTEHGVSCKSAKTVIDGINAEKYNVNLIPLSYTMDGKDVPYDLDHDFDGKAFYDAMRNGAEMKTSMANSELFRERFEETVKNGDDVIYIGLSAGVSGTVRAAEIAKEEILKEYPEAKIAVINSLGAGLGIGMQVVEIGKLIEEGKSFEETVSITEERKHHMCQFFTVDDLTYLKKGGRISGATAAIGTLLNIKPLLRGDEEGHIVSWGKCRGINKCILEIVKKYDELVFDIIENEKEILEIGTYEKTVVFQPLDPEYDVEEFLNDAKNEYVDSVKTEYYLNQYICLTIDLANHIFYIY